MRGSGGARRPALRERRLPLTSATSSFSRAMSRSFVAALRAAFATSLERMDEKVWSALSWDS